MSDIAIAFDGRQLRGDFALGAFDLVTGNDLRSAVLISLLTETGWWADAYEPDAIGCRLLELQRAVRTNATLLRARDYCRAALAWLVEDKVASKVEVDTAWQGTTLAIGIVITQATGVTRYSFAWDEVRNTWMIS